MKAIFLLFLVLNVFAKEDVCSFPDNLSFPEDTVVLGIAGIGSDKEVRLSFKYKKPVALILLSHGPVKWNIVGNDTKIVAIVTYSVFATEFTGLPGTLPLLENSEEKGGRCSGIGPIKLNQTPNQRVQSLAWKNVSSIRIKQLIMKLFPRRPLRFYFDEDFANLELQD